MKGNRVTGGSKPWKLHLAIVGGFFLLALLLTWPTPLHAATHLPGDGGDDPSTAWNLWWLKYSLLNRPQNPFFTDVMFYPIGLNLALYTLAPLNGITALPLLLNLGVVAASNLHLWFSLTLSGYGAFLLTRYLLAAFANDTAARWSAALAGFMVAFASSKLFYVSLGQYTMASTHWIPFAALYFIKMRRRPGEWRWPALCALFLVLQAYTEMIYASFLVIFMALYWLYWLAADRERRVLRPVYLRSAGLLAVLFGLGISPIMAAMLPDLQTGEGLLVVRGGFAGAFSADLLGFFIPTMRHPWLGGLVARTGIANFDKAQHIYLGYSLLLLAGLGVYVRRRDPAARFWLAASLLFALLCLGPEIFINGQNTHLPGPFRILQSIPILKGNRYPSRYSVMLVLALAVLAAPGIYSLLRRGGRRAVWLPLLIALLFGVEHLSIPLPQSNMTVPPAYRIIAADPDDAAVLDIPFAWRNGFRITGAYTTGFMFGQFYQTEHQKPILHGNTSRNPEFKFQYFTAAPVLSSLRILETGHPLPAEQRQADRHLAPDVLRFFGLKYIVVRPEPPGYLNDPAATIPYIESVLPVEKIHAGPGLLLYRAALPPLPNRVDLLADSPLRTLYFAEGWGVPGSAVVAQQKTARLFVPLNGQAQTAHLTARLWDGSGPASGTMRLELNGWRSEPLALSTEWQTVAVAIPAGAVAAGLNEIHLRFEAVFPVAPPRAEVTVFSAGEEAGNLGHIYLNGVDVSPNRRGYNIALIAPGGQLLEAAAFDTHADLEASASLARFIAAAPPGALVAVAAADEAGAELTADGVDALRSV
ncbi:MAG: interleukin-like EMT inducer domain-containing protein, partial [Anaerolineae bacterium]